MPFAAWRSKPVAGTIDIDIDRITPRQESGRVTRAGRCVRMARCNLQYGSFPLSSTIRERAKNNHSSNGSPQHIAVPGPELTPCVALKISTALAGDETGQSGLVGEPRYSGRSPGRASPCLAPKVRAGASGMPEPAKPPWTAQGKEPAGQSTDTSAFFSRRRAPLSRVGSEV